MVEDTEHGPWQAAGGAVPGESDPLKLLRSAGIVTVSKDAATNAALEALGYITSEDAVPEEAVPPEKPEGEPEKEDAPE